MDTLVLNASYEPLALVPWQRAVTLLFEGKVEVVEEYDSKEVRSVSVSFKMPSVVRFIKWIATRKKAIKFSRENIYARDGGKCQYCGHKVPRSEYTYDHVNPRSLGGKTEWTNIVTACIPCNQRKGGRTPEKANMRLLTKPVKPDKLPANMTLTLTFRPGMPEAWKSWLRDIAYWNGSLEE